MNELNGGSSNNSDLSIWKRKEGKWAMIILGILGLSLSTGIFQNLERVTWLGAKMMENVFNMVVSGIGISVLLIIVSNGRIRTLGSFILESCAWHLGNFWVGFDKIGAAKAYMVKLLGDLDNIDKQMAILNGRTIKLDELIEKNQNQAQECMEIAQAAKRKGDTEALAIQSGIITECQRSIAEYSKVNSQLKSAYNVMQRIRKEANVEYRNTKTRTDAAIERRGAFKGISSMISSAINILKGGKGKAFYDMSMEMMTNDATQDAGKMQDFLNSTSDFFKTADLRDDVAVEKLMKLLDQWESNGSVFDGEVVNESKSLAAPKEHLELGGGNRSFAAIARKSKDE